MSAGGERKPPKRPPRPSLSAEERSIWQHVAASIDRRAKGKPRVPEAEAPGGDGDPAQGMAIARKSTLKPRVESSAAVAGGVSQRFLDRPVRKATALRTQTAIPEVDRRKARRIAAGVIEIEARLDLHGMTQSAAHGRLIGFLQSAVARGLRTVLVITGKGGSRQPSPTGTAWWEADDTGILRRSVPRWLAEPPIRGLVIGCQPASPRHGGDGALYILLKRRKEGDRGR